MDFWTGDTHLGHYNIIKYCNRPFDSIDEHDSHIINNINEKVKQKDRLYIAGDFCFCGIGKKIDISKAVSYRCRINCENVILIVGNHDRYALQHQQFRDLFLSIHDLLYYRGHNIESQVCHYSMNVWNKSNHGSYHFFAHSHGTEIGKYMSGDVGVDVHNFYPLSTFELVEYINKKWSK